MKKLLYFAAFAALSLSACSSTEDEIFDQSAAERLEAYKKEYADVLTSDGGLWTMEYFSNPEEPGYLFVMRFDKNGSVDIAANHQWIGDMFKQQTSLWKMIADNGPVLSFNSYNSVFHILSDPADIPGTKDEDGYDIDETGFGHEGDYEFQVMDVSDDQNTIRLLGKKRLYDIYMRRLDPSTDVKSYMDEYKEIQTNLFCKEVPTLLFTDADGERYVVKNAYTGVLDIYPEAGDEVEQTRTGNFIITKSGIRFLEPLEYVNASNVEKSLSEFKFVNNFSLALVDNESAVLNSGTFEDIINLNHCSWRVDLKTLEGDVKDAFNAFTDQLKSLYGYKSASVNEFNFDYNVADKSYVARFYIRTGSKSYESDRYYVSFANADGGVKISKGEPYDSSSSLALNAYSELQKIFDMLTNSAISYTTPSDCGPKSVKLNIGNGSMTMNAI